jgi:hypothetical protein
MGRAATRALQISIVLGNRSNRNEFYQTGDLVAFPSLAYLAVYGNMSQKTAQRALDDLKKAGLIRVEHRYDQSNRYYLILPPDAEKRLFQQDAINRKRQKRRRAPDISVPQSVQPEWTDTQGGSPRCPPNLDSNLDLNPLSKSSDLASLHSLEEREGAGEEGSGTEAETSSEHLAKRLGPTASNGYEPAPSPAARSLEAECFALARKLDIGRGPALCAVALKDMPAANVLFALRDCDANGGDIGEYLGPEMVKWQP